MYGSQLKSGASKAPHNIAPAGTHGAGGLHLHAEKSAPDSSPARCHKTAHVPLLYYASGTVPADNRLQNGFPFLKNPFADAIPGRHSRI